jgi:hypothetical protein
VHSSAGIYENDSVSTVLVNVIVENI